MQRHELHLFADYHQFYLQDDSDKFGNLADAWTQEATHLLLAVAPHVLAVGTVRNMEVPVIIEVHESRPSLDLAAWDQVNLASLRVDTGRIVVAGCTDYFPDAFGVTVAPGEYAALVCYSGLATLSEDGLEGDDRYVIALYPGKSQPVSVLKQRDDV